MDSTLLKGLSLLEALIHSDQPLGVSALSATFALPKSNIHRSLNTLMAAGYVTQNAAGSYYPTLKTWEMGTQIISRHPLRRAAVGFMHTLQEEAEETVNLVVLDGDDSLYIHQVSSSIPIRASSPLGERSPAIMTVSGKTMLAFHPDAANRLRRLYAQQKSPKPPKKLNDYLKESETIRANGYAMSQSVWRPSINSLAGVILGPDELPAGAIAVIGPKERFVEEKMQALVPSLLNTCMNISRALGAFP